MEVKNKDDADNLSLEEKLKQAILERRSCSAKTRNIDDTRSKINYLSPLCEERNLEINTGQKLARSKKIDDECHSEEASDDPLRDEYGEPMEPQYLQIDFTPTDDVGDDDYNMAKCILFWQFLDDHPELHPLRITPSKMEYHDSNYEINAGTWRSENTDLDLNTVESPHFAVKWMLKDADLVGPAFVTKPKSVFCDDHEWCGWTNASQCDENKENIPQNQRTGQEGKDSKTKRKKRSSKQGRKPSSRSSPCDLQNIITEMQAWDMKHPRSMDPPGQALTLNTAEMVCKRTLRCVDCSE